MTHCQSVHHKSYMDRPEIEPRTLEQKIKKKTITYCHSSSVGKRKKLQPQGGQQAGGPRFKLGYSRIRTRRGNCSTLAFNMNMARFLEATLPNTMQ